VPDAPSKNWSRNVTFEGHTVHQPTRVEHVQEIVASAARADRRIHAVGSAHSFSTVAATDAGGELVSMTGLASSTDIDTAALTVTVDAGIRYGELSAALHASGYALHNLPSLPHITVGGAIATATHGSGDGNGNLASAVRAIEIVLADGTLTRFDRSDARFSGMIVALGALGIVVRVMLAIEPTFDVAQTVFVDLPFARGVDHLDEVMGSAYSVSLFTTYRNETLDVWCKRRIGVDGPAPLDVLGARAATRAVHPVPGVDAVSCTPQLGAAGPWPGRLPHFRAEFEPSSGDELQSEYFVPRSHGPAALRALHAARAIFVPLLQVSEVRTVAADDLWLSTASGRDTLALHFTWLNDQARVMAMLPGLEAVLAPFDARPHWGKLTAVPPNRIREFYPNWEQFDALIDNLDPGGMFTNPYVANLRSR
jgi:alditol oxidase